MQLKRLIEWHLLWKFACGFAPGGSALGGFHLNEIIHCWVNNTVDACHIHRVRRHRGYIMPKDDTHELETVSNRHLFHGHAKDSKHMMRQYSMLLQCTALTQRPVSTQCPAIPSNIFFIKLSSERSFFIEKKANFSMEIHMRYSLYRIIGEMDVIERFDSKRNHILIK